MINILYVYDSGGNCLYFERVLAHLSEGFSYKIIRLKDFPFVEHLERMKVLIYQTYPDSDVGHKYNKRLINQTDKKFLSFPGVKILLDSFDWPEMDGYLRFNGMFPRVKHVTGIGYFQKRDVILTIPHAVVRRWSEPLEEIERSITIHCAFKTGCYDHRVREDTIAFVRKGYESITCFQRIPALEYENFLRSVRISIMANGFGPSGGNVQTLQSGALLFVEESAINGIQILPHAELVDGEDYVSFTLKNIRDRLEWVLTHDEEVDRIRKSGQRKFFEGYDYDKSARQLEEYLVKTCVT